jgi:chromosome segregation ATPase
MTRRIIIGLAIFASVSAVTMARADTETDRLREALRSAIAQTRQLEDQRTALQARVSEIDRVKAEAKAQVDAEKAQVEAAKAESRDIQKQYREAIDEFNKRFAERDETIEKWKAAYEEAANVARSKDAERAKFQGEAAAYKASVKSCQAKNTQMLKASNELLQNYKALTIGGTVVAREPVLGLRRVEIQNYIQSTHDKLLDQKVVP